MATRIDESFRRRRPRRRPMRGIIIAAIIGLLVALAASARFYTDVLWFNEVGFSSVLWTSLRTQFFVGALVFIATASIIWANLFIAGRLAPAYRLDAFEGRRPDPLDRYREALIPYLTWIRLGIAAFIGLTAGLGAAAKWQTVLLWSNRAPFGIQDPQFNKDVGFYVFELPFYDLLTSWVWFAFMASLLFAAGAHYFQGSIQPERGLGGIQSGALAHLSVLLGLLALIKTAQYVLGTYMLNFSERGVVHGASYTDVNAQLLALRLLAIISIISAGLFLVNIWFRRFSLPIAAVGIWILTAFLAGFVWPTLVQRFSVDPQELEREREFIGRNIEATREAYGLSEVETRQFAASTSLTAEDLSANDALLQNVRLWDPPILADAYRELQSIRPYYRFEDVDIDRYEIDGQTRQVLLAARELSLEHLPEASQKWTNLHLQYTHGYGLVASLANESTTSGQPEFLVKDLPGTVRSGAESLESEEGGLYYGEIYEPSEYSIVNSGQQEINFDTAEGVERTNYAGAGGVEVGNLVRRIAFALREADPNLVLSGLINSDSRIMIYKNVRDRVSRAAPFLALDNDPYLVATEEGLVWILDAYTHTNFYPYSQREDVGEFVDVGQRAGLDGRINYVRNSVKITVDAYDGTISFYIIDESDPMVVAWRNAFPDLFTDEEPPAEIVEHFRYPEDLLKIQSEMFRTYHMTDPDNFYSRNDEWSIPIDPSVEPQDKVDPTYLLFNLPGESEEEFLLVRPFTPRGRNNMVAMLVARNDPAVYGELLTLDFPRQTLVSGPVQVDTLINQDPLISSQLTLLRQEGSDVRFARLVTLPIEDSILYVQPIFVEGEALAIPELTRVALVFGEEVVMEETFEEALTALFDLDEPTATPTPTPGEEPPEEEPPVEGTLEEIIQRAATVYERAQQALADGDFESYGRLIEQLGRLLERAAELSG
jgi:uncharacterized protein